MRACVRYGRASFLVDGTAGNQGVAGRGRLCRRRPLGRLMNPHAAAQGADRRGLYPQRRAARLYLGKDFRLTSGTLGLRYAPNDVPDHLFNNRRNTRQAPPAARHLGKRRDWITVVDPEATDQRKDLPFRNAKFRCRINCSGTTTAWLDRQLTQYSRSALGVDVAVDTIRLDHRVVPLAPECSTLSCRKLRYR